MLDRRRGDPRLKPRPAFDCSGAAAMTALRLEQRRRLNSWKEIASFFERDERTVKRWEHERDLPIHRIPGEGRSKIYANTDELTRWLASGSKGPRMVRDGTSADAASSEKSTEGVALPAPALEPKPAPHTEVFSAASVSPAPLAATETVRTMRRSLLGAPLVLAAVGLGAVLVLTVLVMSLRPRPSSAPTRDPQAAELFQEGVHDWALRTPTGLQRAVDEFTQAIVRDPGYAQAYVGLSRCYLLLREYAGARDAEAYPKAEAAVTRAIALDGSLAEAHATLGFIRYYWNRDPQGAEASFNKSLNLGPNDPVTHHWWANILKVERRFPEALREIETAAALDPASSVILADKGTILISMGRMADGRQLLEHIEQVEPLQLRPHCALATLYLAQGDPAKFLAERRAAAAISNDAPRLHVIALAAEGLARGGRTQMLTAMLEAQRQGVADGALPPFDAAVTSALLGRRSETLFWLRQAVDRRDPNLSGAMIDTCFDFVRRDTGFRIVDAAVGGRLRGTRSI
jgi:tetratricopeptide (TPR) repeat protein